MTNTQFCKSFFFEVHQHKQYYSVDRFHNRHYPGHRFVHITNGSARFYTANETLEVNENDIFFIPKEFPYCSHWYPDENSCIRFYLFGCEYLPTAHNINYKLQIIRTNEKAAALLHELEQDLTPSPLTIGIFYHFVGEVFPTLIPDSASHSEVTVNQALEFMRQTNNYSIKDVADHCGVCESNLYSKFRKQLHKTPIEARHQILIEKACELLYTTDLSVEEISDQLSFSSSSYFRKIFLAQTGTTPSKYRKESKWI